MLSKEKINRIKMAENNLIHEVLSMTEDQMNIDDIVLDKTKKDEIGNYEVIQNQDN